MKPFQVKNPSEQLADYLREKILDRTWTETMPGEGWIASELAVGRDTVKAAVQQLERQGLLKAQGAGRRRRITLPKNAASQNLHVNILRYESYDEGSEHMIQLCHKLEQSGHSVSYTPSTLSKLHHDPERVAKHVKANPADAWILVAAGKPVLEWFVESKIPAFALFGRMTGTPIAGAGPTKDDAIRAVVRRLLDLGHRKIVMLAREERRKPTIGPSELIFLDSLKQAGLEVGPYNLPDWEDTPEGFRQCLDSLFKVTPPTACVVQSRMLFNATQHYLARSPYIDLKSVSLCCSDYDFDFDWCHPSVACFHYDLKPVVRYATQWVNKLALGENDKRQIFTKTKFVDGETISSPH